MDSGAFSTLLTRGFYPEKPAAYAALIKKFSHCGRLLAAVAQDYMCERFILERTGLTVGQHQILTTMRYDELTRCDTGGVYVMPVLQGYDVGQYIDHLTYYGARLKPRAWVGVG